MACFVLQNIAINRNQPEFDDEEEDVYARARNNRVPLLANDIGETGVAWDRGWVGQLNFKYVPDVKIKKYFYLTK